MIKKLFSTPKRAIISTACIAVVVVAIAVGIFFATGLFARSSSIGEANAQNFAFTDAGVDPASAQLVKTSFDRENGRYIYEVEFYANGVEYEYWIDAENGAVLRRDSDGQVAGARNTTGDVLRPALQIIKTTPGITCVSGAMLLLTKAQEYGEDGVLVMGDVAVTPVPDVEQLAQIAVCTARTAKAVAGFTDPRVAMLSFSTKGSAKHECVDKVVAATQRARELDPTLKVDGDLQADAALVPSVGASKAPGSPIAGNANVLVVPNLEVGNIGYKLVQRLGRAEAIGPILQGIARPVNDLSRGCSTDDVYKMIAVTANQAIALKEMEKQ